MGDASGPALAEKTAAPPPHDFVIRDPMLGDIRLTPAEKRVLDSDIFQRQRGVKQLGTSMLLYPSAVQTRFVHALGNLQIAGLMIQRALDNSSADVRSKFLAAAREWLRGFGPDDDQSTPIDEEARTRVRVEQIVRIAGMCHDLGHFPMGHVLEYALEDDDIVVDLLSDAKAEYAMWHGQRKAAIHEFATLELVKSNGGEIAGELPARPFESATHWLCRAVYDVLGATHDKGADLKWSHPVARALGELVSSEIDSDRAEYLRRDSAVAGAGYGQYDMQRLVDSFAIAMEGTRFYCRPTSRALPAIQTFLLERVKAYGHLYYHNLGVLMDGLLTAVLLAVYRPKNRDVLLAELGDSPPAPGLDVVLAELPLQLLNYKNFGSTRGYVDDATLWHALRKLHAYLDPMSLGESQIELRRLRTYLAVVLRRRHLWITLWKRPEEFRDASERAFQGFREGVQERHKADSSQITQAITKVLRDTTDHDYADGGSVLNFIAHEFYKSDRLQRLAQALERELPKDGEGGRLFVVLGQRASFRPLKDTDYRIIDGEGTLRKLVALSRPTVRATNAWWFEGYPQLRMYIVTERELDKPRREQIRRNALVALTKAMRAWHDEVYGQLGGTFDPEEILYATKAGPPAAGVDKVR